MGDELTWGEFIRFLGIVRKDTNSQLAASLEGWDFPVDRATLATLDLFDLTVMANSDGKKGRPTPHGGRPFRVQRGDVKTYGDAAGRSRADVVKILNERMGHSLPG